MDKLTYALNYVSITETRPEGKKKIFFLGGGGGRGGGGEFHTFTMCGPYLTFLLLAGQTEQRFQSSQNPHSYNG